MKDLFLGSFIFLAVVVLMGVAFQRSVKRAEKEEALAKKRREENAALAKKLQEEMILARKAVLRQQIKREVASVLSQTNKEQEYHKPAAGVRSAEAPGNCARSGSCGEDIRWELRPGGTLHLSGTGDISNYEQGKSPFANLEVNRLEISEGITSVGNHAFFGLEHLTEVKLPSTLVRIGQSAFAFCKALPQIEIPESVREIGPCAFDNCHSLRRALLHPAAPTIHMWAFAGCPKLTMFVHMVGTAAMYALKNGIEVANIDKMENIDLSTVSDEEEPGKDEVFIGVDDDVVYDEDTKMLRFRIGGLGYDVPIGHVEKIQMCTSDIGPFEDDMWTEIHIPGRIYKLMSGNPKSQRIIFENLRRAFELDSAKIVEASCCTQNRTFLLYERKKQPAAEDSRLCAKDGDAEEQLQLGRRLYYGEGVSCDLEGAAECFRRAAELGLAEGQYSLGVCYENGVGLARDFASAVFWYQKAAEQGMAEAQHNLGVAYNTGRGVAMDKVAAAKWMEKAAERGFALAQFNIGAYYEFGNGVQVDWDKAFYWYQKASDQDFAMAQTNLALCYLYGNGTEKNMPKAMEWMEKAAAGGDANAQHQLPLLKEMVEAIRRLQKIGQEAAAEEQSNKAQAE